MRYHTLCLFLGVCFSSIAVAAPPTVEEASAALEKAVTFYHQKVASHGGYVYRYSADLKKREGEGITDLDTVWVQPPGTPAVGMAYLNAYERTKAPYLLAAAKDAGHCLVRGQLRSGGWNASIGFAETDRRKNAYRADKPQDAKKKQFNVSTFDDDKTQSAVRFLSRLDQALQFKDEKIHESVLSALDAILDAQFPNGGWAQGWETFPDDAQHLVMPANYPSEWPRKHPGGPYWWWYTFNDNSIHDTIDALLIAADIYKQPKYRESAINAGRFMILAQMPDPQPAWAQQYNFQMQPVWARKFEPAAITGGESQNIIQSLMRMYVETGDKTFLAPIPKALDYLKKSQLPDGKLARFYELKTNKPLYFTRQYELTYDDSDMPTHYGFKVPSKLEALEKQYKDLVTLQPEQLEKRRVEKETKPKRTEDLAAKAAMAIQSLDSRGAWLETGKLKYYPKTDDTTQIIASETFIKNIETLSRFIEAN